MGFSIPFAKGILVYGLTEPPSSVIMSFNEYGRPSQFDFVDEELACLGCALGSIDDFFRV
jgi:hypothetical protein